MLTFLYQFTRKIRKEYLYDLGKTSRRSLKIVCVFSVSRHLQDRALLIPYHGTEWCMLLASTYISVFQRKMVKEAEVVDPSQRLDELQMWNSFSYYPSVTLFYFLRAANVQIHW